MHLMTKATTHLFVYGTLKPGCFNFRQIEPFTTNARKGTIEGILVTMGAFPALVPGRGIVQGVVLDVDEAALEIADRIEGYSPDRHHCLYVRKEVIVRLDDGQKMTAWTYVFASPSQIADQPPLVVGHVKGEPIFAWSDRLDD